MDFHAKISPLIVLRNALLLTKNKKERETQIKFTLHYIIAMTAIGLDILNIGSSKWNKALNMEDDFQIGGVAGCNSFLLPAVENVHYQAVKTISINNLSLNIFNYCSIFFTKIFITFFNF